MNHDEVFEDTWMNKKNDWLDYLKKEVLCKVFGYARYSKNIEQIMGNRLENSFLYLH